MAPAREGITGDVSSTGVWEVSSPPGEENDFFPWGDDSVVPVFTEVGSGGAGNSPPVADTGGPYEGGVGNAVNFDGSDLQMLTKRPGHHKVNVSPNKKYFIDQHSRVDLPPQHECLESDHRRQEPRSSALPVDEQ